jgi:long-chain acyl-CoA synthetase
MKTLLKLQGTFKWGNQKVSDALYSLAPYFSENRILQRQNTDRLLGTYDLKWKRFFPRLLDFAIYCSFFHRSDRTVYEQVLFRLESRSYPVTYFDVVDGEFIRKSAQEMRQEILAVAGALRATGVGVGDRVALTGLNSTRYLAVDIAIGLVGAVSVPTYYTAPPSETDPILKESRAKLFFIGIPSLLKRVAEFETDLPIVSLCREDVPNDIGRKVTSWNEFLSQAPNNVVGETAPVGFDDIAT